MGGVKIDQKYKVVPIDSIVPHPDNPNRGDVDLIAESIEVNDWYGAVIVQASTMRILAGEHRWRAAKQQGATKVPVILRDVDNAQALRIMLIDNEAARQSRNDAEALKHVLDQLADIGDLKGTGVDLSEYEAMADAPAEDDEVDMPEPPPDDDVETQYAVIILCDSEKKQRELFDRAAKAYGSENVRVVSV